ncbi:pentapeptide repeat-containing protein [Leptolyngbya sp. 'hensonii']|uniref:pentapeptide repeat-containing protein n=1 Tax=Leptolyngbya sp. 'hensonii' TaxID=1922337 RepID=UPI001C0E7947|nr:pentapeptide repeat-containing protein [Leptolyngbya sp. 'hensonii']
MQLPFLVRRWAAWTLEVSLVTATAILPFSIGGQINHSFPGATVPLNPILATVEETTARALGIPKQDMERAVTPLTNLLWTGALAAPLVLSGVHLYLLTRTGKTPLKRLFGVRVVTPSGAPPGLAQVLFREGVGRWGLPLGIAYLIWRYMGAFPDLAILAGLASFLLAGEHLLARLDGRRRALHDRLSGTFVIDTVTPYSNDFRHFRFFERGADAATWQPVGEWSNEDEAIAAIVLTPEPKWGRPGIWVWMRQHPGLTLLTLFLSGMGMILGTFVGTQVYIQSQTNQREFKQQDNEVFLTLVNRLAAKPETPDDRQSAVLALGKLNDPRALPFLADLLSQAETPLMIDAIQQSLVSKGAEALPPLHKLNLALKTDLESLKRGGDRQERTLAALRQRATQRAIAKILTIYSGQVHGSDLNRIDLGQTGSGSTQFTLVLDRIDLSGIQLRGADMSRASLQRARFYGPGADGYWGTFDDWIADLSDANLKGVDLTGAFLSKVPLERANLLQATLNQANLSKARMNRVNLSSARLIRTNLQQAQLSDASFTGADLGEANLVQANLQRARLGQTNALGATLRDANLTESDWRKADLSGADLSGANLRDANLSEAQLSGANLSFAQLQNVNFRRADLSMVDLRGANLDGADFQGATFILLTATSPDQFIKLAPVPNPSGAFRGVNFSRAKNLSPEQLSYICAQGGQHPRCPVMKVSEN